MSRPVDSLVRTSRRSTLARAGRVVRYLCHPETLNVLVGMQLLAGDSRATKVPRDGLTINGVRVDADETVTRPSIEGRNANDEVSQLLYAVQGGIYEVGDVEVREYLERKTQPELHGSPFAWAPSKVVITTRKGLPYVSRGRGL